MGDALKLQAHLAKVETHFLIQSLEGFLFLLKGWVSQCHAFDDILFDLIVVLCAVDWA